MLPIINRFSNLICQHSKILVNKGTEHVKAQCEMNAADYSNKQIVPYKRENTKAKRKEASVLFRVQSGHTALQFKTA